jgi:hypothetical protein
VLLTAALQSCWSTVTSYYCDGVKSILVCCWTVTGHCWMLLTVLQLILLYGNVTCGRDTQYETVQINSNTVFSIETYMISFVAPHFEGHRQWEQWQSRDKWKLDRDLIVYAYNVIICIEYNDYWHAYASLEAILSLCRSPRFSKAIPEHIRNVKEIIVLRRICTEFRCKCIRDTHEFVLEKNHSDHVS